MNYFLHNLIVIISVLLLFSLLIFSKQLYFVKEDRLGKFKKTLYLIYKWSQSLMLVGYYIVIGSSFIEQYQTYNDYALILFIIPFSVMWMSEIVINKLMFKKKK